MYMFSYAEYKAMMDAIKSIGTQIPFDLSLAQGSFIIMRHDVEFSVERAYNLAKFEKENGFKSIFFFQITNNTYNMFSKKNVEIAREIKAMGHDVGLHFHMNGIDNITKMRKEIELECRIMGEMLGMEIERFSIHRPSQLALAANMKFDHLINAYQDEFFSYTPDMTAKPPEIKYFSDARHQWNYGLIPDKETLQKYPKIQILTHPYSWTEQGYSNRENFRTLLMEKNDELIQSIDSECKHFAEVKDEL